MKKLILFLFGVSGATGLIYQVVWARKLLLIFGNTTHSLTVVLIAFMAGLALGSLILGYYADKVRKPIKFWGVMEVFIGLSAIFFVVMFPLIKQGYAPSPLIVKFLLSSLLILPATFFMGGTLPVLIRAFSANKSNLQVTPVLYSVNTLGAFLGTLFAAYVMIELLGLTNSILATALVNISIGLLAIFVLSGWQASIPNKPSVIKEKQYSYAHPTIYMTLFVFYLSGAVSFSYEIIWTRLLIPSLGTFIYAFAIILATILAGTALGGFLAKFLKSFGSPLRTFAILEFGIGFCAFLSLIATGTLISLPTALKLIVTLFPASVFMGATYPMAVAIMKNKKNIGFSAGLVYFANTTGSIVGPILTSFYLIPELGITHSLIVLSIINILSAAVLLLFDIQPRTKLSSMFFIVLILIFAISIFMPDILIEKKTGERLNFVKSKNWQYTLLEDEVASTFAFAGENPDEKGLIIDGIQTTTLTTQTKLLAHLPLLVHANPSRVLVIAFGMGTTFRSALSYDINVDAVELVPSVPKTFPMFWQDASSVLANPKGRIIINDGRNYILYTKQKYDIIVVDPPPPINASGTTVLYSREFYEDSKRVLNKDGIFVQWFWYGGQEDDFKMLFASFKKSFPHILVAVSPEGRGVYFLGSQSAIPIDVSRIKARLKDRVYVDLNEWETEPFTSEKVLNLFVGDENTIERFIGDAAPVSDDHPNTEYFYLRHKLYYHSDISPDWVHPVSGEFREKLGL